MKLFLNLSDLSILFIKLINFISYHINLIFIISFIIDPIKVNYSKLYIIYSILKLTNLYFLNHLLNYCFLLILIIIIYFYLNISNFSFPIKYSKSILKSTILLTKIYLILLSKVFKFLIIIILFNFQCFISMSYNLIYYH
jgi:hypothetical protein